MSFVHGTRLLLCGRISQMSRMEMTDARPNLIKPSGLIARLIAYVDEITGATEIREAHSVLKQNEKKLQDAQCVRRNKRDELDALQKRMKQIHDELDRFSRGDDKYLHLLTEEHAIIKSEQVLLDEVRKADEAEKVAFDDLSSAIRTSHAKEQEQAGRVKSWTVISSTLGALFGVIGAWIVNEIKMRKLKELVPNAAVLTPLVKELSALIENQHSQVASFISEVRDSMHLKAADDITSVLPSKLVSGDETLTEKLVCRLHDQNDTLAKELEEIKRLIAVQFNSNAETPNIVYVGSDMEKLLSDSEKKIESRMKLQTLAQVVFLYSLIIGSFPLVYAFFKSN